MSRGISITLNQKDFIEAMKRWGLDPKEKAMFLMTEVSDNVVLSSRNIGTLKILTPRTFNLYDILNADKLVLTLATVDYLNERYGVDYEGEIEDEKDEQETMLHTTTFSSTSNSLGPSTLKPTRGKAAYFFFAFTGKPTSLTQLLLIRDSRSASKAVLMDLEALGSGLSSINDQNIASER